MPKKQLPRGITDGHQPKGEWPMLDVNIKIPIWND